jgi:hypothetical protein
MKKNLALVLFLTLAAPARADMFTLDAVVRAACSQIDGVSADGTIFFQAGASDACKQAAQSVMANKAALLAQTPITSIQIVSSSTPALNGTYAIDPAMQQKAMGIALYISVNGRFPAGQTTLPWPDVSGAAHVFETTAQFQSFATAIGDYVTALTLRQTPSQPVTIP